MTFFERYVAPNAKAILAFVFALIGFLAGVADGGFTVGEWLSAIAFAGSAAGVTWVVPNAARKQRVTTGTENL